MQTKARSIRLEYYFSILIFLACLPSAVFSQADCAQDTIPPFCFVESYTLQGEDPLKGGILFFQEVAADLCSEIAYSKFYHVDKGKVLEEGEILEFGEHIIQNIVSDANGNFTTCTFKIIVHEGEFNSLATEAASHFYQSVEKIEYPLGSLSALWESGHLGAKAISSGYGDPGGASYGLFQLSSRKGTLRDFFRHEGRPYKSFFKGLKVGTRAFNKAWRELATFDQEAFTEAQYNYVYRTHYKRFCDKLERDFEINIDEFSDIVKDVIWSTAVQHGPANNIFENAFKREDLVQLTEEEIINRIYEERLRTKGNKLAYFPNVSKSVQRSLHRRYVAEKEMALNRLYNLELAASRD